MLIAKRCPLLSRQHTRKISWFIRAQPLTPKLKLQFSIQRRSRTRDMRQSQTFSLSHQMITRLMIWDNSSSSSRFISKTTWVVGQMRMLRVSSANLILWLWISARKRCLSSWEQRNRCFKIKLRLLMRNVVAAILFLVWNRMRLSSWKRVLLQRLSSQKTCKHVVKLCHSGPERARLYLG